MIYQLAHITMAWMKVALLTLLLGFCAANTINRDTALKSDSLERMIREVRTNCDSENDPLACMKLKVMQFLDTAVNKDNFKVMKTVIISTYSFYKVSFNLLFAVDRRY